MRTPIAASAVNAEIEPQNAEDTTAGRPQVIGVRKANMADTVGVAT